MKNELSLGFDANGPLPAAQGPARSAGSDSWILLHMKRCHINVFRNFVPDHRETNEHRTAGAIFGARIPCASHAVASVGRSHTFGEVGS